MNRLTFVTSLLIFCTIGLIGKTDTKKGSAFFAHDSIKPSTAPTRAAFAQYFCLGGLYGVAQPVVGGDFTRRITGVGVNVNYSCAHKYLAGEFYMQNIGWNSDYEHARIFSTGILLGPCLRRERSFLMLGAGACWLYSNSWLYSEIPHTGLPKYYNYPNLVVGSVNRNEICYSFAFKSYFILGKALGCGFDVSLTRLPPRVSEDVYVATVSFGIAYRLWSARD